MTADTSTVDTSTAHETTTSTASAAIEMTDAEIKERLSGQAISGLVRKPFDEYVLSTTIEDVIHRGD